MHFIAIIFLLWTTALWSRAELSLHSPFSDDAVLPMQCEFTIRGSGAREEIIQANFQGRSFSGLATADGSWSITLKGLAPQSKASDLEIQCGKDSLVLKKLLVGEIWMFSGQSNMAFPLQAAIGGNEAIANASGTGIRILLHPAPHTGPGRYSSRQRQQVANAKEMMPTWLVPNSSNIGRCSAIAWWVGSQIRASKDIPIGIVCNAVGGTGTEAWLPPSLLEAPEFSDISGSDWMNSKKISPWARGRAKENLGSDSGAHPFMPSWCYQSYIARWEAIPLTAVVWYQGETNAELKLPSWNQALIERMIQGWRSELRQEGLPFYIVQLPRIGGKDPIRQYWKEYREAQAGACRALQAVNLVVTQDLGYDSPDVHPPDKKPIADRVFQAITGSTGLRQ